MAASALANTFVLPETASITAESSAGETPAHLVLKGGEENR